MTSQYTQYGTLFSYYSAKTRAYLSYKRIPFVERYDGPELNGRIRHITHKVMVPVVEAPDGEILQDTTAIIDALEPSFLERPVFPTDPLAMLLCRIVEFVVDELWISTAMNTRWNDPVSKAFVITEFGNGIGGGFGLKGAQARAIGEKVADRMQSFLPYLGIADQAGRDAATHFFKTTSTQLNTLLGPGEFALGERPSFLDICLHTAYFAHQYRDLGDAQHFLKSETPRLCYFLDSMHAAHTLPDEGSCEVSEGLLSYLDLIAPAGAQFASGIEHGAAEACESADPLMPFGAILPPISLDLLGHAFTRGGSAFSAWKAQRVRDVFDSMSTENRARVLPVAQRLGWAEFLNSPPSYRLERRDFQIWLA
ncbi:MAG: glutathione S-transferase N-terminal domain-containing protein [Proteobacteria bacterium]|nr:glutathione S-transferase N-terminal domain-containing protein [Pseudomonadota bacterium]